MTKLILFFATPFIACAQTATIDAVAGEANESVNVTIIKDSDQDGLLDSAEDLNGNGVVDVGESDPNNSDSDGDGLSDKVEIDAGTNPIANQFFLKTDFDSVPISVQSRMKGYWDFETYNNGYLPIISNKSATAIPNFLEVNEANGNLKSAVKLGDSKYIEINPKDLWERNRNWNLSFSAKFDTEPVVGSNSVALPSNSNIPLFSVFATNYRLANLNSNPIMELVLRNGRSFVNSAVSGVILTLFRRNDSSILGEWLLPEDVNISEWNNFAFNADGTYQNDDRWCYINGLRVPVITPNRASYGVLYDIPGQDTNVGYILCGATKVSGVVRTSPIKFTFDRLGVALDLSARQNAELTQVRDTDEDGVSDLEELKLGTDPFHYNNDTDNDGLTNGEEAAGVASFDGGTTNVTFGATDSGFFDTDGDLFDDYWEAKYFSSNVDPNDPNKPLKDNESTTEVIEGDYDNDGLSNYNELINGTNPNNADTDGDGIEDADEADYGSNPLDGSEVPLDPSDFYGDENLGSYAPIGNLGTILKANSDESPMVVAAVGDGSSSHSERWRLSIGSKQLVAPDFGEISPLTPFALGTDYFHEIRLNHVGTDPTLNLSEPDYDYTALVYPSGNSPFLVCDPEGLLGNHDNIDIAEVNAKKAYLIPLDGFSWSQSYSGGDAVGPRHRKVALNGRPMPDEKPQQEEESDLPDEETYIDAFNLGLHHDTTFNYMPLAASDLVLQASASTSETGFSSRSGLRPYERLDLPFGAGWTSSLCSYVEVVENIGGTATDPVSVNVIDEAGRPQRFGTVDFNNFFPWPSSKVDKKTYLNTLTRNGDHFVMKKKFGSTLIYEKSKAWFLYSSDRVDGSTTMRRHTYWRLVEARDRYGVRMHYDYGEPGVPNEVSLIPHKISSPDRPNQFLVINRTSDHRRVQSITDSRGNVTNFTYATDAVSFSPTPSTGPVSGVVPRLSSVTYADTTSTSYTYNGGVEEEIDTTDPANPRSTLHYHFNVDSVTDKRGNTHAFSYDFDQSKKYWDSSVNGSRAAIDLDQLPEEVRDCVQDDLSKRNDPAKGEWKTMYGMPRRVTTVTLPGASGNVSFVRQGEMTFSESVGVTVPPVTTVTDAESNVTVYEFLDVSSELVDIDGTETSISKEWMVYYLSSKIHHGGLFGQAGYLGTETYEFDKASGLSLWRTTDFSGNITTWEYGDDLTQPLTGLNSASMSKWADPTAKIDALGRREEYTYGSHRVMSRVNNPYSTLTLDTVDGLGRRTLSNVLEDGTTSLSQSRDDYQNLRFKAFKTKSTTLAFQSFTGQPWETNLVSQFLPDDRGRLWLSITDPDGLKLTTENTYDFNNNLTSTIDPRGNRTIFEYDKLNRLTKTTYPSAGTLSGEAVTHSEIWYDRNGNKAASIDEEGNYTIFHYDERNRRIRTIRDMDGLGLPTRNAQDLVEEATKGSVTAGDLVTEVQYNGVNAVTHAIDSNGNVTRSFYDAILRPLHIFTGLTLAESTDLQTAIAAAASSTSKTHTELLYTNTGLVMPGGGGTVTANPGGTAFNSSGFKPTVMIRHDAVQTATDPSATLTTYAAYDALYRPVRTETEYEPGSYAVSTISYGSIVNGKEVRQVDNTDDRGKVTRSLMDGLQRTTSVTDAFGTALAVTSSTAYSSTGLAWKSIDALGRESETDFDTAGRAVASWLPDPISGLVIRSTPNDPVTGSPRNLTAYDKNNNVTVKVNPLGARWEYEYDARNRKIAEHLPEVVSTAIIAGEPKQTVLSQPLLETSFDGVGNAIASVDAKGNTTRSFYDKAYRVTHQLSNPVTGNPSSDKENLGANDVVVQSVFDKNSNVTQSIDGNGNLTSNQYDALNRLVATSSNPDDGQPNAPPAAPKSGDIVVSNAYDSSGNLVSVTDGEGHTTGFRYDGLGRKTRTIWDVGSMVERTEQSTFDGVVQLTRIDPLNRLTTYQYDLLNRLSDMLYTGASKDDRHYTYNEVNNLLSVTYPNETAGLQAVRGTSQTYDKLNRVTAETSTGVTHTYSYDKAGNRLNTDYGITDRRLACQYDKLNRLLTCTETSLGSQTEHITRYFYDYNSNITRKVLPNNSEKRATFDAFNRKLTDSTLSSSGSLISAFDYSQPHGAYPSGHDNVGNLLKSVEQYGHSNVKNRTLTNSYDHAYRLLVETIAETSGTTTATGYLYDKGNNRLSKSVAVDGGVAVVTTSQYGNTTDGYNSNQLKSASDGTTITTFTYDLNGNRSEKKVNGVTAQSHTWDHENRLTQVIDSTLGTFNYAFDHRTRRVLRDESLASGQSEVLSFSGGLSVQEYHSGASTPEVEYIRGSDYGGGIGGILYTIRGNDRSYNAYNSRGDVVSKTNDSGAITWQSSYEAFGTRTQEEGNTLDRQKANTKDEDRTGLLNEGMRFRDLEFGVFISRDPAGHIDGPNVYSYVTQNPWSAFDPHGLEKHHWYEGGALLSRGDDVAFMAKDFASKATQGNTSTTVAVAAGIVEGAGKFVQAATNVGNIKGMKDGIVSSGETVGMVAVNAKANGDSTASILGKGLATGVGAVTGVNGIVEGATGKELGTGRTLSQTERVEGTLTGISQAAGMAAGGLQGASAKATGVVARVNVAKAPKSGTGKPWTTGAKPNSKYNHLDKNGKVKQTAVYDKDGNVIGHVDYKNHGKGAPSGHGHKFPEPGNPASGHGKGKPHIPRDQLPRDWTELPKGVEPLTPIGQ